MTLGEFSLAQAAGWQPTLKVGLLQGLKTVTLSVNQPCFLTVGKKKLAVTAGKDLVITRQGGNFQAQGKSLPGDKLELVSQDEKKAAALITKINGQSYRGGVELAAKGQGFTLINLALTEEYLKGVLPKEMPPSWPAEALKTQAVAARTFALKNRGRHAAEGFDLCPTTHCQVYEGLGAEYPQSDKAASDTKGEVLVYKDALIEATFHTDSGGMTENSEDVWGSFSPYLRAAEEVETNTHPWEKTIGLNEFGQKLAAKGLKVGSVKKINLSKLRVGHKDTDRSASGRVKELTVVGGSGTAKVSGNDMRSLFGLKSTLFDIELKGDKVIIKGYGWGHGLGMSQWGAKAYAAKKNYREILAHYYEGTNLKELY
ncbi:MAG: SpoIID/LytB domain-containing protein [Selenomonadaceae bacterium]|nr:SpoIID/LytB domain-containing protein [Selenomonadaceae bacterium]